MNSDSNLQLQTSLIEYPCEYPIKILGRSQPGFAQNIVEVVSRHSPEFDPATVEMRTSKAKKYLSLTCTIRAQSKEQLDSLYQELCDHPMVEMVL
ncbi:MAG: HP0495 family protein [Burkholderiales bacterium]